MLHRNSDLAREAATAASRAVISSRSVRLSRVISVAKVTAQGLAVEFHHRSGNQAGPDAPVLESKIGLHVVHHRLGSKVGHEFPELGRIGPDSERFEGTAERFEFAVAGGGKLLVYVDVPPVGQ